MEFTAKECIEYHDELLAERESFKHEHGEYPRVLRLNAEQIEELLWGMNYVGIAHKANPDGERILFYGAVIVTDSNEGFSAS